MDKLSTKFTFWELISLYNIEIPIMQRDYAQGRINEKVNSIREEMIDSLFLAINNESNIDFDFVYGTVQEKKLFPLDGQQRLTTLFLLHWYIAMKEGHLTNEVSRVLDKFTYSTRISSRNFCKRLAYLDFKLKDNIRVSEVIRDSNWYFMTWDKDPTIKAMLVMIDDIHAKFFNAKNMFEKLYRGIDENPPITFSFISLGDYSFTDNLYIKMNARGKALSNFENLKAKFIQYLKYQGFEYKYFEDSIDDRWTDLLWEYKSSRDNTIDDAFILFFTFITEMISTEDAETKDMNSPYGIFNIGIFIQTYDSSEKIQLLYDMLDLWSSKDEIFYCMKSIFSTKYEEGKTRLFEDDFNLMGRCLSGENLSLSNKVLLYLVMRRLLYYKKHEKTDFGINDFARVVRNLISRIRTLSGHLYQSDFRYGRHAIPFVQFIVNNLLNADDVYSILPSLTAPAAVREESLQDEKDKAIIINNNNIDKKRIHHLEDLEMFKGSIHNVIGLLENNNYDYANLFTEIFSSDNTILVTRTLLSIADYGIRLGGSALGDRVYFGTEDNWNTILTSKRDDGYIEIFKQLITHFNNLKEKNVNDILEEIINTNSSQLDPTLWRYYFVKYPGMLCKINTKFNIKLNMLYAFKNRNENNIKIQKMDGSTLNGYHISPFYREIARKLGDEKCNLDSCRGINSEEGAIVLKCGVSVEQREDGSWFIPREDELDNILQKVIEKYNTMEKDHLDYIERGLLLCEMLHDAQKINNKTHS